jgi:putative ABC transport system ATP-binding protein
VSDLAVDASGVSMSFGATPALVDVRLEIRPGESVALMGPSGSGKSTLLLCLAGIITPDSGHIATAGLTLTDASDAERSRHRLGRMGFVFQFGDLIPELSLVENVALPLQLTGIRRRPADQRAREMLDLLGIADCAERRTGEVSGGQAQRAAVARALVHEPAVIFADEPTGALDSSSGEQVLDLLMSAAAAQDAAVLIVTHDHRVAAHTDRLVVLRDGQVRPDAGEP